MSYVAHQYSRVSFYSSVEVNLTLYYGGVLPKDHCVKVPWEYINVCGGYSDQFCKIPHTIYIHMVSF